MAGDTTKSASSPPEDSYPKPDGSFGADRLREVLNRIQLDNKKKQILCEVWPTSSQKNIEFMDNLLCNSGVGTQQRILALLNLYGDAETQRLYPSLGQPGQPFTGWGAPPPPPNGYYEQGGIPEPQDRMSRFMERMSDMQEEAMLRTMMFEMMRNGFSGQESADGTPHPQQVLYPHAGGGVETMEVRETVGYDDDGNPIERSYFVPSKGENSMLMTLIAPAAMRMVEQYMTAPRSDPMDTMVKMGAVMKDLASANGQNTPPVADTERISTLEGRLDETRREADMERRARYEEANARLADKIEDMANKMRGLAQEAYKDPIERMAEMQQQMAAFKEMGIGGGGMSEEDRVWRERLYEDQKAERGRDAFKEMFEQAVETVGAPLANQLGASLGQGLSNQMVNSQQNPDPSQFVETPPMVPVNPQGEVRVSPVAPPMVPRPISIPHPGESEERFIVRPETAEFVETGVELVENYGGDRYDLRQEHFDAAHSSEDPQEAAAIALEGALAENSSGVMSNLVDVEPITPAIEIVETADGPVEVFL